MSCKVRMVPRNWRHPKGEVPWSREPAYLPLIGWSYSKDLAEWEECKSKWAEGLRKDWLTGGWEPLDEDDKESSFEDVHGGPPEAHDYMPEFEPGTATHFMLYETVSAGTPRSPACESPEALASWLADNPTKYDRASYETWLAMINGGGWAPTAIGIPGHGVVSGNHLFDPAYETPIKKAGPVNRQEH